MAKIHVDGTTHEVNGADNLLQACLSLGLQLFKFKAFNKDIFSMTFNYRSVSFVLIPLLFIGFLHFPIRVHAESVGTIYNFPNQPATCDDLQIYQQRIKSEISIVRSEYATDERSPDGAIRYEYRNGKPYFLHWTKEQREEMQRFLNDCRKDKRWESWAGKVLSDSIELERYYQSSEAGKNIVTNGSLSFSCISLRIPDNSASSFRKSINGKNYIDYNDSDFKFLKQQAESCWREERGITKSCDERCQSRGRISFNIDRVRMGFEEVRNELLNSEAAQSKDAESQRQLRKCEQSNDFLFFTTYENVSRAVLSNMIFNESLKADPAAFRERVILNTKTNSYIKAEFLKYTQFGGNAPDPFTLATDKSFSISNPCKPAVAGN